MPVDACPPNRHATRRLPCRKCGSETSSPPKRNSETHALHVKRVLDHVDVLGISTKRFKVVLDSVNGAGCVATATLLNKLGCQLVHINATPDGQFPHEPEPTAKNLTGLADEVRRQRAPVGFAQDPDADRLAIVDENGTYIGEEYSLALAAQLHPVEEARRRRGRQPLDQPHARRHRREVRRPRHPHAGRRGQRRPGDAPRQRRRSAAKATAA